MQANLAKRLKGVNHIGMTVRDLGRSLAFYNQAFGLEPLLQGTGEDAGIARSMGLEEMRIRYAFLQLGDTRLELIQFDRPVGRSAYDPRTFDVGSFHVCFDVDGLMAKYEQLKAMDLDFVAGPIQLGDDKGAMEGLRFVYLRDPDGLMLQLYEVPTTQESGRQRQRSHAQPS